MRELTNTRLTTKHLHQYKLILKLLTSVFVKICLLYLTLGLTKKKILSERRSRGPEQITALGVDVHYRINMANLVLLLDSLSKSDIDICLSYSLKT